jgi:hypothetical protein
MLDQQEIVKLVEDQIRTKVHTEMESLLEDHSWNDVVEAHLMRFAQDRVAAKFASAEYLPKILDTINDSVKRLFDSGQIDDFIGLVDEERLNQMVDDKVSPLIDQYIENKFNDPTWLEKVQSVSNHAAMDRVEKRLAGMDIDAKLDQLIEQKLGNKIKSIEDQASTPQITIMDDVVVNENEFVTTSLNVVKSATIQDLVVKGRVNTDNASWNELKSKIAEDTTKIVKDELLESLTDDVFKRAQRNGIDFDNVKVNGEALVNGDSLGRAILHSNLRSVGRLEELEVTGHTSLADVVTINKGRVGINTKTPTSALDVWDDDINITVGKKSKGVAKIHLSSGQLELGTNSDSQLTIDPEGKVRIKQLMIGRNNISWDRQIPNYSGQKGDIVFNMDPTSENDTGWQCLGGFRWRIF